MSTKRKSGVLDNSWADAARAKWTVLLSFDGDDPASTPPQRIDLHDEASNGSEFLRGVMGALGFGGDVHIWLDPSWRHCALPLLRCVYSPDVADFFLDQLLLRKTFAQVVAICHCALYLGVQDAYFWDELYVKVASRRMMLTRDAVGGDADKDAFRCDGDEERPPAQSWSSLPLTHAVRWLDALRPNRAATRSNALAFVASGGASLERMRDHVGELSLESKARADKCNAQLAEVRAVVEATREEPNRDDHPDLVISLREKRDRETEVAAADADAAWWCAFTQALEEEM